MRHNAIVAELGAALQAAASPRLALSLQRYFPAPVPALGVSNGEVAKIAAGAFARHGALPPEDWLALAGHFARSHAFHEHLILASALAARAAPRVEDGPGLLAHLQAWLENDVGNWAQCDDLCIKPLYACLKRHPGLIDHIYVWGRSSSPWCRRASNVGLVKFVGRSEHVALEQVLANCERLLGDPDPYVQKGIGWMLKVAGQYASQPVLAFLDQHRTRMDRSTLRYAVENLPAALRHTLIAG